MCCDRSHKNRLLALAPLASISSSFRLPDRSSRATSRMHGRSDVPQVLEQQGQARNHCGSGVNRIFVTIVTVHLVVYRDNGT
jgi:hypothetical protein